MALFIRQNEDRSKLQERLAAELQERGKKHEISEKGPMKVEDYAYLKDTKDSSSLTWVWVLILIAIVILIIYFMYRGVAQ